MITSSETPTRSRQSGGAWGGFADRILRVRELGLVVVLLLICTIVTARAPRFLDGPNLEQVALSATLVCIVALGQALVIIARQIDLSVGAIVAMSAFVTASWLEGRPDGGILMAFLIGCGVGVALGTGNALLVAVVRIPAVVATLGTLAIYRGAAIVIARGRQISATVLPESYQEVAQLHIAGVPLLVWLALLLTIVFGWMARYTRLGRNLYALGSSPPSARVAGISENGRSVVGDPGVRAPHALRGKVVMTVGSGHYLFSSFPPLPAIDSPSSNGPSVFLVAVGIALANLRISSPSPKS